VLTEERIKGRKAADLDDCRSGAGQRFRAASLVCRWNPRLNGAHFTRTRIPGNLLVEEDGSLAVIDFGKIGAPHTETRGA